MLSTLRRPVIAAPMVDGAGRFGFLAQAPHVDRAGQAERERHHRRVHNEAIAALDVASARLSRG